jgi:hypothetical protein
LFNKFLDKGFVTNQSKKAILNINRFFWVVFFSQNSIDIRISLKVSGCIIDDFRMVFIISGCFSKTLHVQQ